MLVKQLSVFLENRVGRMKEVTEILGKNEIDIVALSLADTSEYGLVRLIVSDPEKGKTVLKEAGISAKLTNVVCVKLSNKPGRLHELLKLFSDANVELQYMYAFAAGENASIVMKISNIDAAIEVVKDTDMELWRPEEAYNILRKL